MTSRRLLFVCYPDTNHPIGGVADLPPGGTAPQGRLEAYVLQEQPGFRADWFNSDAHVLDLEAYKRVGPVPSATWWCCRKHGSPTCRATYRGSPR